MIKRRLTICCTIQSSSLFYLRHFRLLESSTTNDRLHKICNYAVITYTNAILKLVTILCGIQLHESYTAFYYTISQYIICQLKW